MKKSFIYLSLIILPLLFFLSGIILKYAQGPYYINLYDPAYVYLINSLNLAQFSGYGVGHFDHPGTPVQMIGAVIIKIYFLISKENSDMVIDVFSRPEAYLFVINKFFVAVNSLGLFLLGLFVYKISKNLYLSIFLQLSPFTSTDTFYALIDVTPDNFSIFICLCFIAALIYYLYRIDKNTGSPFLFMIIFSIISGLGLANKLSFIPLLLIPLLIIRGFKNKFLFIIFTIVSFIIFTLPALSNYAQFLDWVKRLIINDGTYGSGKPDIINFSSFFGNISKIFVQNYFFGITYLISLITLIINKIIKSDDSSDKSSIKKETQLLFAVFLAMTLQLIIVGKHFHPYSQKYMVPAFMLSIVALALSAQVLSASLNNIKHFNLYRLYSGITIIVFAWSLWQIIILYNEGSFQKAEAIKTGNFLRDNSSGMMIVPDLESSCPDKALAFTTFFAASQNTRYKALLTKILSSKVFYSGWAKEFFTISDSLDIKQKLLDEKRFIVQLSMYAPVIDFLSTIKTLCNTENISCDKIFENGNGEIIYEVKIN